MDQSAIEREKSVIHTSLVLFSHRWSSLSAPIDLLAIAREKAPIRIAYLVASEVEVCQRTHRLVGDCAGKCIHPCITNLIVGEAEVRERAHRPVAERVGEHNQPLVADLVGVEVEPRECPQHATAHKSCDDGCTGGVQPAVIRVQ